MIEDVTCLNVLKRGRFYTISFYFKNTAASHGIRAMPTFQFYINSMKVDEMKGADGASLEAKVNQWSTQNTLKVHLILTIIIYQFNPCR